MSVEKLAILESFSSVKPDGFEHVFSFSIGNGDSYPEDYVGREMPDQVYRSIFEYFFLYLERLSGDERIFYREVDLLWCFKKKLLNFIYFIELRYQIFRSVYQKKPSQEIFLERLKGDGIYPDLRHILQHSPFEKTLRMRSFQLETSFDRETLHANTRSFSWKAFIFRILPARFSFKSGEKAEIVFFTDFLKAKNLFPFLRGMEKIWYSPVFSPRLTLRALQGDFACFQTNFNWLSKLFYSKKAEDFIDKFKQNNIFKKFALSDLEWPFLLEKRFNELLKLELPQILFDIDKMHFFFQRHPRLRSVLLDEDVAPVKNAFCQVARQYGVSSFVECHGTLGTLGGFLPLTASKIFVWGDAQKEKLTQWGCPPDRIIVSGRSLYADCWNTTFHPSRKNILESMGLTPHQKTILVGLMVFRKYRRRIFENERREIIQDLFALIALRDDCQFIIKVKKGVDENQKIFEDWILRNKYCDRVKVITNHSSIDLARASDIVIAHNSTFAIDGFAMRKPVIVLREKGLATNEEYRKCAAFYCAESSAELVQLVADILQGSTQLSEGELEFARKKCLNEGGDLPQRVICEHLTNPNPRCEKE